MYKLFISVLGSGFILFFGLVSCRVEKKSTDVYQSKPPVIRNGQGSQDLRTWNLLKNKEFDLQDVLDFSESAPARIEMRSHCRSGVDNFYGNASFTGTKEVQIWQVLPVEALTDVPDKKNFSCGLELNLYNEVGSNHVYTVAPVPVVERLASAAKIGVDGIDTMPPRLTPATMANVRVRYANTAQAAVKLICQDMEIRALPFEQVVDLAHFNFAAPQLREGRDATTLQNHPVQSCRALISVQGKPAALSNLVRITLQRPPISIQEIALPIPALGSRRQDILDAFSSAQPVVVARWTLSNTDVVRRYFRFPKRNHRESVQVYAHDIYNHPHKMNYNIVMVKFIPALNPARRLAEDPDTLILFVEPGESLNIDAVFQTRTRMQCNGFRFKAIRLENYEPATVDELAADGTPTSSLILQPPAQQISMIPNPEAAPEMLSCDWL